MSVISSRDETGSSPVQTAILREAFLNRKAFLFFVLNHCDKKQLFQVSAFSFYVILRNEGPHEKLRTEIRQS